MNIWKKKFVKKILNNNKKLYENKSQLYQTHTVFQLVLFIKTEFFFWDQTLYLATEFIFKKIIRVIIYLCVRSL